LTAMIANTSNCEFQMIQNRDKTNNVLNPTVLKLLMILLICLIVAVVISMIILSSVPPVSRDALTHHLAVPKLWLKHGGIYEIPTLIFSYYPMNLDLLYMVPLFMGNDIAPKYIHFVFALMTAGLIFNYLRRRLDVIYALLGSLFFLTIPVVQKLSFSVYVDLGLMFFTTGALLLLFRWREMVFKTRYLIISGILCGLALGTKYNGLIAFFILSCCVPFLYLSREGKSGEIMPGDKKRSVFRQIAALKYASIFMIVALLLFSPWMIKNVIWTGNPVYPLYKGFFSGFSQPTNTPQDSPGDFKPGPSGGSKKKSVDWQNPFALRKYVYQEQWWQTVLIPFRIFFEGRDDDPKYFDGVLNPFLLILPLFIFLAAKQRSKLVHTELIVLVGFAVIYLFFVYFQIDMRIRWVAPIIPPLVIVAMFGLDSMNKILLDSTAKNRGSKAVWLLLFISVLMLGLNSLYLIKQFRQVQPFGYLSGRVTRDEYIQKRRPEYQVIQYANTHLGEENKILSVFLGGRLYYSDIEMDFREGRLINVFQLRKPPEMISRYFENQGLTHIIIRYDIFNNWVANNFGPEEVELAQRFFWEYTTQLTTGGGYGLYRLR